MAVTKKDLIRYLKLIEDNKINLKEDIIDVKDYKDYWLKKSGPWISDSGFILEKEDWKNLKLCLDSENYFPNKELEEYWDEQIKLLLESRKDN